MNKFDMVERTTKFGERLAAFCAKLSLTKVNEPIIVQLVRAGTSFGANYSEADGAVSKKDFRNKIGIARKEAKETLHFLRIAKILFPNVSNGIDNLYEEARQLNLILSSIYQKLYAKNKQ